MHTKLWHHILTIILLLSLGLSTTSLAVPRPAAYLDPALVTTATEHVSVIVTGTNMAGAIQAVEHVGGTVMQELWLIEAVSAQLPTQALPRLAADWRVVSVVRNHSVTSAQQPPNPQPAPTPPSIGVNPPFPSLPTQTQMWAGQPWRTELSFAAVIDTGAAAVHSTRSRPGKVITGDNVTIAVVDSGVFFNDEVKKEFGRMLKHQFIGQADFVSKTCPVIGASRPTLAGRQEPDHCFQNVDLSLDGYGHGSHVAGLIWNNYRDVFTGMKMGIAPSAHILSVRVLGNDGTGTYADTIAGIQYVVANRTRFNIRVMNLSLSAEAATPYFFDPLNRAVERAWHSGIVVVVAAGNTGPGAETISAPGNDPYVITVGAVDTRHTPLDWSDDSVPTWSASGPTLDGFIKPDVLAPGGNLLSYMYNNPSDPEHSAYLAVNHPDYSETTSLFRMSGTSMAAGVTSGVAALMLQAHPELTPDQVKFRLKYSALPFIAEDGAPGYNPFQQGHGRIWAPAAVWGEFPVEGRENLGMDLEADLAHSAGWLDHNADGWVQLEELDPAETAFHYAGPVSRQTSADGSTYLYTVLDAEGATQVLGAASTTDRSWMTLEPAETTPEPSWSGGQTGWLDEPMARAGGHYTWSGGHYTWSGGHYTWSGGHYTWSGGHYTWSGGHYTWSGGHYTWSGGHYTWSGGWNPQFLPAGIASTRWVEE